MTKLRKLTALLLAGALTLLLLTACSGGGGSSSPKAQAEAEVMRGHPKQPRHRKSGHMTMRCSVSPKTSLPIPIWTPN